MFGFEDGKPSRLEQVREERLTKIFSLNNLNISIKNIVVHKSLRRNNATLLQHPRVQVHHGSLPRGERPQRCGAWFCRQRPLY